MDRYPVRFGTYPIPAGYCLSARAIEHPTAEYSVELWIRDSHFPDLLGITADNAYVRVESSGEIISSATRFTFLGGWLQRSFSNVLSGGGGDMCPAELSHGFRSELMELTFN